MKENYSKLLKEVEDMLDEVIHSAREEHLGHDPSDRMSRSCDTRGLKDHIMLYLESEFEELSQKEEPKGIRPNTIFDPVLGEIPNPTIYGQDIQVYSDIAFERLQQDGKHGGKAHDDTHAADEWAWLRRVREERISDAIGAAEDSNQYMTDKEYRKHLVEIAALCVAEIESMDRRKR